MKIIEEYRRLTEEIAIYKSQLCSYERSREKQSAQYKPRYIKAIDYSEEKVQIASHCQSMLDTYDKIIDLNNRIWELENEINILYTQRDRIEEVISEYGNRKKKSIFLYIKGNHPQVISELVSCSERQVYRYLNEFKRNI